MIGFYELESSNNSSPSDSSCQLVDNHNTNSSHIIDFRSRRQQKEGSQNVKKNAIRNAKLRNLQWENQKKLERDIQKQLESEKNEEIDIICHELLSNGAFQQLEQFLSGLNEDQLRRHSLPLLGARIEVAYANKNYQQVLFLMDACRKEFQEKPNDPLMKRLYQVHYQAHLMYGEQILADKMIEDQVNLAKKRDAIPKVLLLIEEVCCMNYFSLNLISLLYRICLGEGNVGFHEKLYAPEMKRSKIAENFKNIIRDVQYLLYFRLNYRANICGSDI